MQLQIPLHLFKGLKLERKDLSVIAQRTQQPHVEIRHEHLSTPDRESLLRACERQAQSSPEIIKLKRQLQSLLEVQVDPLLNKVKTVGALKDALVLCFRKLPHSWVFHFDKELQHWMPYAIERVNEETGGRYSTPHVRLTLVAWRLGQKKELSIDFYHRDLRGKRVPQILEAASLRPETEELLRSYQQDHALYTQFHVATGGQFAVNGWVQTSDSENRWKPESYRMSSESGLPALAVMDHLHHVKSDEPERVTDISQWHENGPEAELPLHPLMYVYDLSAHIDVLVHAADLKPYEYQSQLDQYLVIPASVRKLLKVLRRAFTLQDRDVVPGKTGGCLVLLRGEPGLGKTLTAQVFAEQNQHPLYELQCSQLGITPGEVEENLGEALLRARRWNAVLLINEADVFVRTRANDLVQNAIVGVFLRLLENLSGVCFLTTNQGTIIDDAINSRALVHLDYSYPAARERNELFGIQARLQQVIPRGRPWAKLARARRLSGRDIRQLVKLAKLYCGQQGGPITAETLAWALRWRQVPAKTNCLRRRAVKRPARAIG